MASIRTGAPSQGQPAEATDRLTRARAVRLRRRDAANVVLMSADRAKAEAEVMDVTARVLADFGPVPGPAEQ